MSVPADSMNKAHLTPNIYSQQRNTVAETCMTYHNSHLECQKIFYSLILPNKKDQSEVARTSVRTHKAFGAGVNPAAFVHVPLRTDLPRVSPAAVSSGDSALCGRPLGTSCGSEPPADWRARPAHDSATSVRGGNDDKTVESESLENFFSTTLWAQIRGYWLASYCP